MGVSREGRPSEIRFNRILSEVRSMDKLLWLGKAHSIGELEEAASIIKFDLDEVIRLFRLEAELPEAPPPPTFVPAPYEPSPMLAEIEAAIRKEKNV